MTLPRVLVATQGPPNQNVGIAKISVVIRTAGADSEANPLTKAMNTAPVIIPISPPKAMPIIIAALVLQVLLVVDQEMLVPEMIPKLVRKHDELQQRRLVDAGRCIA